MRNGHLVVAVADHQQCPRAFDAPAQKLDEVQRRFVGPVRIFDHHQQRFGREPQVVEYRFE